MLVEDTRGAVLAAMGYPYDGPLDLRGMSLVWHLPEIRRAILDTPPAVQLALDHLLSLPEVDPTHVELVGVSLGAFFVPAVAAMDARVTRLWVVHGAGKPRDVLEHNLRGSAAQPLVRAVLATAADVVFAGPRLAPELWLPRVAPRPVVIVNALEDDQLPRDAIDALYRSAREPKEQIWLPGPHVHPRREDLTDEIVDIVLSRATADNGR